MLWSPIELLTLVSIGLSTGFIAVWALSRVVPSQKTTTKAADPDAHVFTFEHSELVGASPAAQAALDTEDLDEDIYNQLIDRLLPVFPNLLHRIETRDPDTDEINLTEITREGPVAVRIRVSGARSEFTISGIAAPLSRHLLIARDQAEASAAEMHVLRGTVETAPFAIWREDSKGRINWVNRTYTNLLAETKAATDKGAWPPPRLFQTGAVVRAGEQGQPCRSSLTYQSGATKVFETTSFGHEESSLHFAIDASATVKAEESLRSFTQTLTQTFAYLPIGLAIFDRTRQLCMFNPALTDLTELDPQWLTARPTLVDFLNNLREKRITPERKDFSNWRTKISALEQSAKDGNYSETWTLPTGQTYRVTGRPHPEGAIAFLFEDITSEISLTRKFRRELELNQALFDSIPEAIAVFGSDGVIRMSNDAYCEMWGVDPGDALGQITIQDATRLWRNECAPSPLWGDIRDFIFQSGARTEWQGAAKHAKGNGLRCRISPLPGGLTLVGFTDDAITVTPATKPAEVLQPTT